MKRILVLLAGALLAIDAGAAMARDHDHDRHHERGDWHGERHGGGWRDERHHHHDGRHEYRRYAPPPRYGYGPPRHWHPGYYYAPPPRPHWARGHRYYGPRYVVADYGYYRLRPPPPGAYWMRNDGDFLLVALATGIILDIVAR